MQNYSYTLQIKRNKLVKYIILFLLPYGVFSQTINGKVYDNESTVKGIKIYNITQKILTYTNNEGDFAITAVVNDTLFFESLFHHPKMIQLKQSDFQDVVVFELIKSVNELGEVLLSREDDDFNPLEYTQIAERAFERDRRNNMQLYIPQSSYSNGVNFKKLAKMIGKLFKNKNRVSAPKVIEYKHLDSLFKKDDFFNLKLIEDDLDIPERYALLFLEYCETKYLNKDLLLEENKVILLDSMVNISKDFLKITESFDASKDSLRLKN